MSTGDARSGERPGAFAWALIALGCAVMLWAVIGVFAEADRADPRNWITWVVGAAVVHDFVLLPAVVLAGVALAAVPGPARRACVRWAVAVAAVITLATFPVAMRWGASASDPSELPLPVARNLVIMWCVILPGAWLVGALLDRRRAGGSR